MARAKRHYITGYIWHITHRCHKREFLLKFLKDRHRYLQWLYQAKKRYKLTLLNYKNGDGDAVRLLSLRKVFGMVMVEDAKEISN